MSNGWVTLGAARIAVAIEEIHLRISVDIV